MKKIYTFVLALGAIWSAHAQNVPPCTLAIDSEEAFAQWTTIDANGDGSPCKFEYSADGYALYTYSTSDAADDWLISPAVEMEAGQSYNITVTVRGLGQSYDRNSFTVCAGSGKEVADMSSPFITESDLRGLSYSSTRTGVYTATETGDCYVGLHLTSSRYQCNFAVYSMQIEKIVAHPGAVTDLTVAAGEKGALEAILTWTWPTENDLGGNVVTITGANIYRGTSSYFTVNDNSKVGTLDAPDAEAGGQATWTDNTITSSGKYYYKVVPFNADGASTKSASSVQSPYIGKASSLGSVSNVVAATVAGSDRQIALTWTAPSASEGYYDPADVAYKITRAKDGGSAETLETAWSGEQPYVDTVDGLGSYVYTVYTIYNGSTAWTGTKSNAVVTGGTCALPYSNTFDATSNIALWTLFHGSDGSRDWGISSKKLCYWGGPTADAWAVTPKFTLQAGKAYQVTFSTYVSRAASPKNLAVAVGAGTAAGDLTEEIFSETISSTFTATKTAIFSVPADGDYCVGFHCFGSADSNDLFVDDLKIEEIIAVPQGVADAKAEAGAEGALSATLTWINPDKNTAGATLSALDKVVVSCGGKEVATVENPVPGEASGVTVDVEAPGVYSYAITAYLDENTSETVEVTTGWVGNDTPKAPASVTLTRGDDGARLITFEGVTEGVHGGWIGLDNLKYEIKRNDDVLTSDLDESPYIDTETITDLGVYTYYVAAINGEYVSEYTASSPITLGDALGLPYSPDFEDASSFDLWTLGKWKYTKMNSLNVLQSGSMSENWGYTPPLNMKEGTCTVSFRAICTQRYEEDLELYLVPTTAAVSDEEADAQKIGELHVTSVSYPNLTEMAFTVPNGGNYHVALVTKTTNMYLGVYDFSVEQTSVTSGIDRVEAVGDDARYFDLQGRAVGSPRAGQLLIRSVGGKSVKIKF